MVLEKRLVLDAELRALLGSNNVYFQPPENVRMSYPAIVYARMGSRKIYANNLGYLYDQGYQITYISDDPDGAVIEKLSTREKCSFVRSFVNEGLNHDIFSIYI